MPLQKRTATPGCQIGQMVSRSSCTGPMLTTHTRCPPPRWEGSPFVDVAGQAAALFPNALFVLSKPGQAGQAGAARLGQLAKLSALFRYCFRTASTCLPDDLQAWPGWPGLPDVFSWPFRNDQKSITGGTNVEMRCLVKLSRPAGRPAGSLGWPPWSSGPLPRATGGRLLTENRRTNWTRGVATCQKDLPFSFLSYLMSVISA